MFLTALWDSTNIEGQRIAARGLVNLTSNRRDYWIQVVSELNDEIRALYRNELDPVVGAYLQNMIHPNGK